jgi:hypothetical protein
MRSASMLFLLVGLVAGCGGGLAPGIENPALKDNERATLRGLASNYTATLGRPGSVAQCGESDLSTLTFIEACGVRDGRDEPSSCPGEISVVTARAEAPPRDGEYLVFWDATVGSDCTATSVQTINEVDAMVLPREEVLEIVREN